MLAGANLPVARLHSLARGSFPTGKRGENARGISNAMGQRSPMRALQTATMLPLLLAISLPFGVGCAIPTRVAELNMAIPKQATPVAIDAGLTALDDPTTKRRMEAMLASPEMKAVQRELLAGMIDGSLATLSDKDRADRIGALASRYTAGMIRGITKEIAPDLGPAAAQAMRSAMKGALSPENQREAQHMLTSFVETTIPPITKGISDAHLASSAAEAMTQDLGPAMQKVLKDNLAPGLAEALKDESVRRELGATARVMGREMVLGANEAIAQIQQSKPQGEPSLAARVSSFVSKGATLADTLTWVLVAVVLMLCALVVKLLMQAKRYRQESEQRAAATRLIEEARKASKGKPWSDELLLALQDQMGAEEELRRAARPRRPWLHLRKALHST